MTLNLYFGAFHSVWVHLESSFDYRKLGAKRAELVQLMQKFMLQSCLRIFATKALDAPHWTPNSCFVAFHRVWVHLEPFCYCMKLGAKWTELVQIMQKFVPRCCVRIFRNEHIRSAPLDPKLIFWCVSYYLGKILRSEEHTSELQ